MKIQDAVRNTEMALRYLSARTVELHPAGEEGFSVHIDSGSLGFQVKRSDVERYAQYIVPIDTEEGSVDIDNDDCADWLQGILSWADAVIRAKTFWAHYEPLFTEAGTKLAYSDLRGHAEQMAMAIYANTPNCADQSAAIRKLRECMHACIDAIGLSTD